MKCRVSEHHIHGYFLKCRVHGYHIMDIDIIFMDILWNEECMDITECKFINIGAKLNPCSTLLVLKKSLIKQSYFLKLYQQKLIML